MAETGLEDLRARVDAQERVLMELVGAVFGSWPTEKRAESFVSGLEAVSTMEALPRQMPETQAMEHADHTVMMQSALERLIPTYRSILGLPEEFDR